tara:strand:- start:203 stop:367 length:165 start_codon:yes stop_codon:yes gene_type:complete
MAKEQMGCDYCDHIEYYEDENSFFQGEMFGLKDDSVSCPDCLEKQPTSNLVWEN